MKWINSDCRTGLSKYICGLAKMTEIDYAPRGILLPTTSGQKFRLDNPTNVAAMIVGDELTFLRAVDTALSDSYSVLEKRIKISAINKILWEKNSVEYRNGEFIKHGFYAEIRQIELSGVGAIEKRLKDKTYLYDFNREKRILVNLTMDVEQTGTIGRTITIYRETFDESLDYYHMESATGDLFDYMSDYIGEETRFDLANQVLQIGEMLFRNNILHRDLHPRNFLLFEIENKLYLKVADFGLAKYASDIDSTNCAEEKYKLYVGWFRQFIAEKLWGSHARADFLTDLYSIARIINFLLTGNPKRHDHLLGKYCRKAEGYKYQNVYDMIKEIEREMNWRIIS